METANCTLAMNFSRSPYGSTYDYYYTYGYSSSYNYV